MSDERGSRPKGVRRVVSTLGDVVAQGPDRIAYGAQARSPQQAHDLLRRLLEDRSTEEFWTILLDSKHRVIAVAQTSVGTLTSSLVHPREVFGPAIRTGAAAVIVAHNHPSGDPEPSAEDLAVTRRLIEVGGILGIPLLDHIVCGADGYVSLRERISFP